RLDPTREYLQGSRDRENDRIQAEKQRQEAELQAAQQHAAALRRRSRILIAVLTVTALIGGAAVYGFLTATNARHQADVARNQADARFREATSLRLVSEAQSMLDETRSGGPLRAYKQLLVGRGLA